MYHVFILFLIITNGDGGVTTEKFKTPSLEKCHQLLLDIKQASTNVMVSGTCIRG